MNLELLKMNEGKILIKGQAGQGVQLIGFLLARILNDEGYEITLINEYSPWVRKGTSSISLIFSKEKIENPFFENPDLEYDLNESKLQEELLNKYNNRKVINMTLLGKILHELKVEVYEDKLKEYLSEKFSEENLKAIKNN